MSDNVARYLVDTLGYTPEAAARTAQTLLADPTAPGVAEIIGQAEDYYKQASEPPMVARQRQAAERMHAELVSRGVHPAVSAALTARQVGVAPAPPAAGSSPAPAARAVPALGPPNIEPVQQFANTPENLDRLRLLRGSGPRAK